MGLVLSGRAPLLLQCMSLIVWAQYYQGGSLYYHPMHFPHGTGLVLFGWVPLGTRRGKNPPEHDTHVLQGLKVLAGAVNLSGGEILYRPVFCSKFGSKKEAMQDFVASFLFRSSATARVLHVQLATPIVKCEPAWKLRKNNVALMFNHKRTPPQNTCSLRYHEHHDVF